MYGISQMDKIQIIGKYEKENKIPYTDCVTDWYGDYNIYEPKLDVGEYKIEEAFLKAINELELKWKLIENDSGYNSSFIPEEKKVLSNFDEMYSCFLAETNNEETEEWRMYLSGWEKDVVAGWDKSYEKGIANLAGKILNMSEDEAEI